MLAAVLLALVTTGASLAAPPTADEGAVQLGLSYVTPRYAELPGGYALYSDLGNIYGTGSIIGLTISCQGLPAACDMARPVHLQVTRGKKTTTVRSGTYGEFYKSVNAWEDYRELKRIYPTVDTTRPGRVSYRWHMPAWKDFPAVTSNPADFRIRWATKVRVTVTNGRWEPYGWVQGFLHYCVRRTNDRVPMITLHISPREAGREGFYEYVQGDRVVAERLLSTARGTFRFPGPRDRMDIRIIRVMSTSTHSGFSVNFDFCTPGVTGP